MTTNECRRVSEHLLSESSDEKVSVETTVKVVTGALHTSDAKRSPESFTLTPCGIHRIPRNVVIVDLDSESPVKDNFQYAVCAHFNYLSTEELFMVDPNYILQQPQFSPYMRMVLVDWLVDVQLKYSMKSETLFLGVNILDRFLATTAVSRNRLQLVGLTALWIASKYEEQNVQDTTELIRLTDFSITRKGILKVETRILNALGFQLTVPSPLTFVRRLTKVCRVLLCSEHRIHEDLACYLIHLSLLRVEMLAFRPSIIASAAVKLAARICGRLLPWDDSMVFYSGGWTEQDFASCEIIIKGLVDQENCADQQTSLTAIGRKFGTAQFTNVSSIVPAMLRGNIPLSSGK